tara:strand:+ start:19 stop:564 length:546 start_codon:yes stop_codon:yes gene_type:complete
MADGEDAADGNSHGGAETHHQAAKRWQSGFGGALPGWSLCEPDSWVDVTDKNVWSCAPVMKGGAIMLETGNKTHMTVAFFKQLSKYELMQARDAIFDYVQTEWATEERSARINVHDCIEGAWGKKSVLIRQNSTLYNLGADVNREVIEKRLGLATSNRPFHIEVMKKEAQMRKRERKAKGN